MAPRVVWIVVGLAAACATRSPTDPDPDAVEREALCALHDWRPSTIELPSWEQGTALVLERTSCFGECPVFEAHLFEDGRVEFRKPRFTKRMEPGSRTLDAGELERALGLAGELARLRSRGGGIHDAPALALHLQTPEGRTHTIHQAYAGCEADRRAELEDQLQRLLIGDWGDAEPQPWLDAMAEQARQEEEAERARREELLELERRSHER